MKKFRNQKFINLNLIVCLLGNFVDQFDLYLFSSLRVSSLKSLGLDSVQVLEKGVLIFNAQLMGMLIGGVLGGILGDKRGRLSILFGSILIYSVANLANAYVTTVDQYLACRFFAGLGLAGELGICITVVLETLPPALRGYGIMAVIAFGHCATILSSLFANWFDWRTCYWVGGAMGLFILFLRSFATEPEMYRKIEKLEIPKGQFLQLFSNWNSFSRYMKGVLVTCPTWFTFSVLIVFAPELGRELGISEPIQPEKYLPYNFGAVVLGDLCCGYLSQWFKSRKWIILWYLMGLSGLSFFYLFSKNLSLNEFYLMMAGFGFFAGYALLSYTVAGEQFGTNLRSTVATSTPNLTRGMALIFTFSFTLLKPKIGAVQAAVWIGGITFFIAILAAFHLKETFGKNLDFLET
jgi:MFS family permease